MTPIDACLTCVLPSCIDTDPGCYFVQIAQAAKDEAEQVVVDKRKARMIELNAVKKAKRELWIKTEFVPDKSMKRKYDKRFAKKDTPLRQRDRLYRQRKRSANSGDGQQADQVLAGVDI